MSRRWYYIRDEDTGNFFLLKKDENNRFGFTIFDDDRAADGGFGIVRRWKRVSASEVPRQRRKQLSWIKWNEA